MSHSAAVFKYMDPLSLYIEKEIVDPGGSKWPGKVVNVKLVSVLAGMDGNRTHPGRLNSAPQTVLKTAFPSSATVQECPRKMEIKELGSTDVR
jgi:hypothetical protein